MGALVLFMCPAGARRCSAQCCFVVIPHLATIVPRIFLSHFCASSSASSSCSCSCNTAYFRIFVDPKNRQIGCVFDVFGSLSKMHCKYWCFFARRKPKTAVFTMFFASCNKFHGIYHICVPLPSKKSGIYVNFSMLQDVVSICWQDKYSVKSNVSSQQKKQTSSLKEPLNRKKCFLAFLARHIQKKERGWKYGPTF